MKSLFAALAGRFGAAMETAARERARREMMSLSDRLLERTGALSQREMTRRGNRQEQNDSDWRVGGAVCDTPDV